MATEKWIGGTLQGLTWGNAFTGSTLNSIASGNAIASDLTLTNASALDIFADLSLNLNTLNVGAPGFVGVYLYPLNDGSTYGDGRFGSSAAGPPPSNYAVGSIAFPLTNATQTGQLLRIVLPPGGFKFVLYNQCNVAFNATTNTCLYRTYNRSVA